MNSVSPVLTEREVIAEQVIALDQPEYFPIVVVRIFHQDNTPSTYTRFRFSAADREAIANGADILISQPHHGPLMPIGLQLALPDEYPASEGA